MLLSHHPRMRGFSLMELIVVVAILGILASIGYPGYLSQIRKSRRSDAVQALALIQLSQEQYRSNHPLYGPSLPAIGIHSADTSGGHYKLAIIGESGAATYSASATALGSQSADAGCSVMTVSVQRGSTTLWPTNCWGR